MKTIVLDDDPTGTQSASDVTVLLTSSADLLRDALRDHDSVYVQTNSRSIAEADAVALVRKIRADGERAAADLGETVRFVLRGDSTLRGHVFAESDVFASPASVMIFVPAFPAGGRTTVDGTHLVRIGDVELPANRTEYAQDPVFGFRHANLVDYVAEKSGRQGIGVSLADVQRSGVLADVIVRAPAGAVILPDAVTDDDIMAIADAVTQAQNSGREVVVRCAAPLAAALAAVMSHGYLAAPLVRTPRKTLLVCGSHTEGATRQLEPVMQAWGTPVTVDTDQAIGNSEAEGRSAAEQLTVALRRGQLALLMSERARSATHNTLQDASQVMAALTAAVRGVADDVEVVIAKGGITSADVARVGLGAGSAHVLGQVFPGVSVWQLTTYAGRPILYVVVPGNVGDDRLLIDILQAVGLGGGVAEPSMNEA